MFFHQNNVSQRYKYAPHGRKMIIALIVFMCSHHVDNLICRQLGVSTIGCVDNWYVDNWVCRQSGVSTIGMSTIGCVDNRYMIVTNVAQQ